MMIVVNPFIQALVFVINTMFGIYILLIMLRFLLQLLRINVRGDPILRMLSKVTSPPLKILYSFIPGWNNIDFAAIFLMISLKMLEFTLIAWLYKQNLSLSGLLLFSTAELLSLLIYIFIFSIIIQAILSWITPPGTYNPFNEILYLLNEPLLRPIQQKVPPIQGIDFSVLIVIFLLMLAETLFVGSLRYYSAML